MLNKIIIAIGSAITIALISFGIYLARELVARTPIAYWHLETAYNSFDYADTYMILVVGVGIGVCLMTTIMELRESSLANAYDDLVEAHEKLTLDRDELRLDAVTQFGEVSGENMQLKKDLKRLINEKG
jgi:hypothetical protein